MFSQQVLFGEAHGNGEPSSAFSHEHHMSGVLHYRFGEGPDILDVTDSAHRACATCGAMHTAGVEFHNSFLVWQASEPDTVIIRIIFRTGDHRDGCVQRVSAAA